MKTEVRKLADIKPAEYNPRITLQEGDTEYEALKNSIDRFGLVEPLVVNGRNNTLVGGHQRFNVLKANGADEAEVIIVDLDEQEEKSLNISLNKIEGDWDTYKLEALLRELDNADVEFTGFSEEEINNIIGLNNESKLDDIANIPNVYDAEPKEPEEKNKDFHIYMSFPNRKSAEEFLRAEGIDLEINDIFHSVTVNMEDYYA